MDQTRAAKPREAMASALKDAMKEVIADVLNDESVSTAIDALLQEYLESSDCWLHFHGKPIALVGFGPGDVAEQFSIDFAISDYEDVPLMSAEQIEDVEEQIATLDEFIKELRGHKVRLEARLMRHNQTNNASAGAQNV